MPNVLMPKQFQTDTVFHVCYGAGPTVHILLHIQSPKPPPFLLSMCVECVCISVMVWLDLLGMGIDQLPLANFLSYIMLLQ